MVSDQPHSTCDFCRMKLFLSSPSGLDADRKIVREVVDEMNASFYAGDERRVEIIEWPRNIAATASGYLQGAINEQTDGYDVLVVIVHHRMGTPTPRASSGTDEEFDNAYSSLLLRNDKQILVFFNDLPCHPSEIDPSQLAQIRTFQQKLSRLGVLFHTYRDLAWFKQLFQTSISYAHERLSKAVVLQVSKESSVAERTQVPEACLELGNRILSNRVFNPQWADFLSIPLAEYRKHQIRLCWNLHVLDPYFRQGFKIADSREPIVSSGGVQTAGMNVLLHLGRNSADKSWFLSRYRHGLRIAPDEAIPHTVGKSVAKCEMRITAAGEVAFSMDGKLIHTEFFPLDGTAQVALIAWGDEHPFVCELQNISLYVKMHG